MAANASSVEAPVNLALDQDLQTQQNGQQPPLPPADQVVEISDNALDTSVSDSETQRTPEQALALSQQRALFEAADGRDSTQGDPFPAHTMSPSKQPPASCEHKKGKQDPTRRACVKAVRGSTASSFARRNHVVMFVVHCPQLSSSPPCSTNVLSTFARS